MALGSDEERARVDAFVRENWPLLAAYAWGAFKEQGRGGLLIEWEAVEAWEAGDAVTLTPHYVTYTEVPRFERLITSYEPEKAIVVALTGAGRESEPVEVEPVSDAEAARTVKVIRADASFRAWTFAHQPPPPEALASTAH